MTAQQLDSQQPAAPRRSWLRRAWLYSFSHYWELPANIAESLALVLVVFVQDVAFRESVVATAALLTLSFCLHGLAYRMRQCQVWPKVIEVAAPLLFYGLTPAAFVAPAITQRTAFITINFYFVAVQLGSMVCGRNFIREYYCDLYPRSVWGTPLLERCSLVVGLDWVACQSIMGLAAVFVFAFGISIETNLVAGVVMCYVMQLLPLLWAVAFTFAYPAWLKRRWGYVQGVRATCYPPAQQAAVAAAAGGGGTGCAAAAADAASGGDCADDDSSSSIMLAAKQSKEGSGPQEEQEQELVVDARFAAGSVSSAASSTSSSGMMQSSSWEGRRAALSAAAGSNSSSGSSTGSGRAAEHCVVLAAQRSLRAAGARGKQHIPHV